MKSKDLLNEMSRLETALRDFPISELSANEAIGIRDSFDEFRILLENHLRVILAETPCENGSETEYAEFPSKKTGLSTRKPLKIKNKMTVSARISGKRKKFDLSPILEDCLGQVALLEELIRLFKMNSLEFIGEVKLHLQQANFKGIAFASHKIRNCLKMLRMPELLVIAEQMDQSSRTERDIKHLEFLFDCFVNEYPILEKDIDLEIMKIKKRGSHG